jgi:ABC-2 type transport system permease protein
MLPSVFSKTLVEQRRALLWWALGLAAATLLTTTFYPSVRENAAELGDVIRSLPEGLRNALLGASANFFSPEGYLQARLFSLFAPLLLLIYAIGAGARAIAGEEEHNTLDILLSTPVRRSRVLLDKAWAMLVAIAALSIVLLLAIALTGPPFEVSIPIGRLLSAVAACLLLASAFGGVALAVGAGTGRRSLAIGVTSGAAAGTYLIDVLAVSIDGLEWLQRLSPFYYYRASEPLSNGLDVGHAAVLAILAIAAIAAGVLAFERRDLAS